MKANKLPLLLLFFLYHSSFAQKDGKADSLRIIGEVGGEACKCIDSISIANKDAKQKSSDIAACIEARVDMYQMMAKMNGALNGGDLNIDINFNKESPDRKRYYYRLEEWLTENCASLKKALSSNEKRSEHSLSDDPKALEQYNKGVDALKDDNYKKALPWFEKAVEIDPKFVFAWDNVGVCNRHLDNLDKALEAYQKSLALDPLGHTPLQNLPIVYQLKKEYDKAIEAYDNLLAAYPGDPEAYFGSGRMYILKGDLEKGLDKLCKAYNIYVEMSSPYRVDAQTLISAIYKDLKAKGQEEIFFKVLKANNIKTQ